MKKDIKDFKHLGPDLDEFVINRPTPIGGPRKGKPKQKYPLSWWQDRLSNWKPCSDGFHACCPCHDSVGGKSLHFTVNSDDQYDYVLNDPFCGCLYKDVLNAAKEIEPGITSGPSPATKKKEKPEPSKAKKKTGDGPVTIKHIDDSGEEISSLDGVAKWWEEYTGVPWSEWKSWGVDVGKGFGADGIWFGYADSKSRKFRPNRSPTSEMRWEHGSLPLWPQVQPELPEQVWIGEGESSTGVLRHLGFEAYGVTTGATSSIPPLIWDTLYERGARDVLICFDVDDPGMSGAHNLKSDIEMSALRPHIVDLTPEADILLGKKDLRDIWLALRDRDVMISKLEALAQRMTNLAEKISPIWSKDFEGMEIKVPEFIIDGFLPIGLTLFAGRPKIGKSIFALNLAKNVSRGEPFLGRKTKKSRVLYLGLEDHLGELDNRRKKQGWDGTEEVAFILREEFSKHIGFLNKGGGYRLAEYIEKHEFGLVIIDTFSKALDCDPNDNYEVEKALRPILDIIHKLSIGVILNDHHHKKSDFKNLDVVLNVIGATSKAANADTIWGVWEPPGATHRVFHVIGRSTGAEYTFEAILESKTLTWSLGTAINFTRVSPRKQEIIAALEVIERGRLTDIVKQMAKVREDDVEVNPGNVSGDLNALQLRGMIQLVQDGTDKWYSLKD